jgi:hypothetical protein
MKIYIHCDGGFGNRFNVLVSGLYLAEQFRLDPWIIWKPNNWCGAELADLFDTKFNTYNEFDRFSFFQQPVTALIHENQFGQNIAYQDPRQFGSVVDVKNFVLSRNQPVLYFTNLIPPWVDMRYVIDNILPKICFRQDLVKAANDIINHHTQGQYFGVHLRMTDFPQKDSGIVERYFDLVKSTPNDRYFICSDDPEVEKLFLQLPNAFVQHKTAYVEKLIKDQHWNYGIIDYNENYFNFNVDRSSVSVQQAIVDLLILSKSRILNTNSSSTFLQTAALLKTLNSDQKK